MYEIRVERTGEVISHYSSDELPTARTALFYQAIGAKEPAVLVGPDGERLARVEPVAN